MAAQQLASEPDIRKKIRKEFFAKACITSHLTKKGSKHVDEDNPLYPLRFLQDKPITKLQGSEFITLCNGEADKLIELTIQLPRFKSLHFRDESGAELVTDELIDQLLQLYQKDLNDQVTEEWNLHRRKLVEETLQKVLYPQFEKKLRLKLLEEAEEGIIETCRRKLR